MSSLPKYRRLIEAALALKVFKFNAAPSDARDSEVSDHLDTQLEEADRENTHLERGEIEQRDEDVRKWLRNAAQADGDTDPWRRND